MTKRLVVGWHTPDAKYTALAESMRAQLDAVGQAHHIYTIEKPPGADWQRTIVEIRPRLVLRAMDDHPDTQILFLDTDVYVTASLDPLFDHLQRCDVAFAFYNAFGTPRAQDHRGRTKSRLHPTGRIHLFNPTPVAREFAARWIEECKDARTEEVALTNVICSGAVPANIAAIPLIYAAYEIDRAPEGAVITHESVHLKEITIRDKVAKGTRRWFESIASRLNAPK